MDLVTLLNALHQGQILSLNTKQLMLQKPSFADATEHPAMGWDVVWQQQNKWYHRKTGSFTGTHALILQSENGDSYAVLFNSSRPKNRTEYLAALQALLMTQ